MSARVFRGRRIAGSEGRVGRLERSTCGNDGRAGRDDKSTCGKRWQIWQPQLVEFQPSAQFFDRASKRLLDLVQLGDFDIEGFPACRSRETKVPQFAAAFVEQPTLPNAVELGQSMNNGETELLGGSFQIRLCAPRGFWHHTVDDTET